MRTLARNLCLCLCLVPGLVAAAPDTQAAPGAEDHTVVEAPPRTLRHVPAKEEPDDRVRYGEPDGAPGDPAPPPEGAWVELADPTPARHGKTFINVDPEAVTFRKVRIAAAKGRPSIQQVRIHFDDGTTRTVRIDRRLHPKRRPVADIDLRGSRHVTQIVVWAERGYPGSYTVRGQAGAQVVATR